MTASVPAGLRVVAKRLFEEGVTRSGLSRLSRALRPARGAVLAYHNVVPEGQLPRGEAAVHVPAGLFRKHLDAIGRTHEVVSLETLLTEEGETDRPRVAITFDDAYRGAITNGLRETAERGFPATVFVAPGLLGREEFWWDRLADGTGTIDPETREAALGRAWGDQDAVLERWSPGRPPGEGELRPLPPACRPSTREELKEAVADRPGVSVGSHTWSHLCLPSCDEQTIASELERSDRWLRSHLGERYLPCVSFPYGRYTDEAVEQAARTYRWALRIDGGLVPGGDVDLLVPRINVPSGLSARGLLVRLSGLL